MVNVTVLKKLLQDTYAHPVPLHYGLLQYYGADYLEFDPEAVPEIIYYSFGINLNSFVEEKLNAARAAANNDLPLTDYFVFEKTANAFTETMPNIGVIQGIHYYQIMPTLDNLAALIPKDEPGKLITTRKVINYLKAVFLHDNMLCVPEELSMIQQDVLKEAHSSETDLEMLRKAYERLKPKLFTDPKKVSFSENVIDVQVQKCYVLDYTRQKYLKRFKDDSRDLGLSELIIPKYKLEVVDV